MGHAEIDVPELRSARIGNDDLLGRLEKIERCGESVNEEGGNARGPAGLARPEGDTAGEPVLVRLADLILGPGPRDRIGKIGDPVGWCFTGCEIGNVGIGRVEGDRSGSGFWREIIIAHRDPARLGVWSEARWQGTPLSSA